MDKPLERFKRLPQSEQEWLETGKFEVGTFDIKRRSIRYALARGEAGTSLTVMPGGIPSDPERQRKLPLINKLFGLLAMKLEESGHSGLMYNQPATGGSGGVWELENFDTRTRTLAKVAMHAQDEVSASSVSLVGSSSGAYMAVRSLKELRDNGTHVGKLILISPAAYPENVEGVPYGKRFTSTLRKEWSLDDAPVFSDLEEFVRTGGSVRITFFEQDDPPIPKRIQEKYRSVAEGLLAEGGDIDISVIPGVGHNFRAINPKKKGEIVDNDSVRSTADELAHFLLTA